jgi:hypothetical protein
VSPLLSPPLSSRINKRAPAGALYKNRTLLEAPSNGHKLVRMFPSGTLAKNMARTVGEASNASHDRDGAVGCALVNALEPLLMLTADAAPVIRDAKEDASAPRLCRSAFRLCTFLAALSIDRPRRANARFPSRPSS